MYADERLYEHADFNERTEAPKFEYRYASPAKFTHSGTKGQFHFDEPKQNAKTNPVIDISDRYTDSNTIQQLAKALANLSHTPPIEIKTGSIPTVARHIFQACPVWVYRVTSQASYKRD